MRRAAALLFLALAACSQKPIELPAEPLTRATACTAVRALELRDGKTDAGAVSFAGFTEILHFGMLVAARDGVQVDVGKLVTVSHRAPIMMAELADQNWRSLVEPCNNAFPETQRPAPPLADDAYEAGMTCFGITDFMARTAVDFPAEQQRFSALADRALAAAQPVLRQRAANNEEAAGLSAGYSARAFQAGTPASLIDQCSRRFAER
jgi:hypothetical protein